MPRTKRSQKKSRHTAEPALEVKGEEKTDSPSSLVTTVLSNETVQSVRQTVMDALNKAQIDVAELRRKVLDSPRVARASERATQFLELAREQSEKAVQAFRENTPSSSAEALERANAAIASFKTEAAKIPGFVSKRAEEATLRARTALEQASAAVFTWRTAVLEYSAQKFAELDAKYKVSMRGIEWAGYATAQAKQLDAKFKVGEKTTAILSKAQELDTKYQLTTQALSIAKTVQSVGDRLTGARVTPTVAYLQDAYNTAFAELQGLAQKIEASAEQQGARVSARVSARDRQVKTE